jgi:hypothetical protein
MKADQARAAFERFKKWAGPYRMESASPLAAFTGGWNAALDAAARIAEQCDCSRAGCSCADHENAILALKGER